MKVLTIRQPWASLIAVGAKTIETRPFSTKYRGPLAIHAGLKRPGRAFTDSAAGLITADWWVVEEHGDDALLDRRAGAGTVYDTHAMPLGAVVALCDLVDVVPIVDSAVDGTRTIVAIDTPTPEGNSVVRLWHDDGRACTGEDDQLPFGDFTVGRFAWILGNVRPIEPVPMKGAQGLRDLPADIADQIGVQP